MFQGDRDRVESVLARAGAARPRHTWRTSRSVGGTALRGRIRDSLNREDASVEQLLQRPVSLHGLRVGHVVDVILEAAEGLPMGLEVRCPTGATASHGRGDVAGAEVVIDSPFALLETDELDFYRGRGVSLRRGRESAA